MKNRSRKKPGFYPGILKLKKSLFILTTIFMVSCLNVSLMAQNPQPSTKVVKGKIVSSDTGEPLPGVTIIIKGTQKGTATDAFGNFSIEASNNDVLVIQSLGYVSEEIQVGDNTTFEIKLVPEIKVLDELVVIGYGVQKKSLVTGAIAQVKGDDLQKRSVTSSFQALQGQVAGVQITQSSGQPGSGFKVTIRGLGTIHNFQPLYIVDGIQTGDISFLNNADIESVEILKDAASAAIYGSQAANGIVLITTKKGSSRKTEVSFDGYYGASYLPRKVDLLNAKEYAIIMNEAAINSGKAPYFTQQQIDSLGEGTDWIDEMIYDGAKTQNYNIGITGGNDVSNFSISLSYTGEDGIVGGPSVSHFDRYNVRINSEHKIRKGIIIGEHLTATYFDQNGIAVGGQYNNDFRAAFSTTPLLPMYDDNGNFLDNTQGANVIYNGKIYTPWYPAESNPYARMIYNNQRKTNNQKVLGDVYLQLTPFQGLNFKTTLGFDYNSNETRQYIPVYRLSMYAFKDHDEARQSLGKGLGLQWDNLLSYNINIDKNSLTAIVGTSAYKYDGSSMYTANTDLTIGDLDHAYINNSTNTNLARITFNGSPHDPIRLLSVFSRISYNYDEKYLLNLTYRIDGSSRFHKNNRWGYFPSISFGWVMTREPFMEVTSGWLDFLRPRISWGQVGNQNIPMWRYLSLINTQNAAYYFGTADFDASGNTPGAFPSTLGNPDLKWEVSEQMNIGFDAYLLKYKLGINFDFYNKVTKDWLVEVPALATSGVERYYINGGKVLNRGIELALMWKDKIGGVNYFINGNITKNKNEVQEVPTDDGIIHGQTNVLYHNAGEFYHLAKTGFPIGYFWGWKTAGVFQTEEEVYNYRSSNGKIIQPNARPGDLKYIDQNDDGIINDLDKVMVGDPNPDIIIGFSCGFDYKGLDFSLTAHGVAGNQIVQSYRNYSSAFENYTSEILARWHGEGTSNRIPRVTENNINYHFSDIFIKDGDFLRIDNITLGYNLASVIKNSFIKQFRIYGSVLNAFTFTKYNGMDPEVGYGPDNPVSGVDLGFYPRSRTFIVGANIKF